MVARTRLVEWSCTAVMLALAASPALAKGGRTFWMCDERGCVQIVNPPASVVAPIAVVPPRIHRPTPTVQPIAASAHPIPQDQLIDMSLVTGVFQ